MKKARIIVLLLALLLLLSACGGKGGFSIEGKWKNVGSATFGQVQANAIVVFDGTNCNFFSPKDTYAFYKDSNQYKLDCTGLLFSETLSFSVKVVDKDNIEVDTGSGVLKLKRVG
jgi:hypothetical protein